jgi:hypothetical protein
MKYCDKVPKGYFCFKPKPITLLKEYERWKVVAKEL